MEVCKDKVECKVSAKRMWHAAFLDGHNCLPKALPEAISHITYKGQGFTKGALRTIHLHKSYAEHTAKEKYPEHMLTHVTEEFEEVDNNAFKIKGKFVEGGFIGILVKQYKQSVHIEGKPDADTCVVHWSVEYEALSEEYKVHAPSAFKEVMPLGYKALETYLLSHDDYKEALVSRSPS